MIYLNQKIILMHMVLDDKIKYILIEWLSEYLVLLICIEIVNILMLIYLLFETMI